MSEVILKVENLSKQYRLGIVGTGTLSHDLNRWWHQIRGKEDPYLKVGESNDRTTKGESEYVWALKDINLEVKRGEVLGIIGKNGAGKSTLLKILSKVTGPTTGSIKSKGRIASLLEVGTGFHPELTGSENIYLNGAILGMTKAEIKSKYDEIVEFSGCDRYIDTPVKRYSSGMRVRLAFAVAAFLEPDILVVDEVLAVGDTEFQKKAIGKMQDISKGEGRTVLFVSHNMESIQKLCSRCLVLSNGALYFDGKVEESISKYLKFSSNKLIEKNIFPISLDEIRINSFRLENFSDGPVSSLISGGDYKIVIDLDNLSGSERNLNVRIQFFDKNEMLLTTLNTFHTNSTVKSEVKENINFNCIIEKFPLTENSYFIGIEILDLNSRNILFSDQKFFEIDVINGDFFNSGKLPNKRNIGKFLYNFKWINTKNDIA